MVFRSFLRNSLRNFRLALPKLGVGWMFALLTSNFNRIAIVELGIAAVLITTLIGLHHFLSPFQVIMGRIADRRPILGMRRTPYLLLSGIVASLVFVALPGVATAMGQRQPLAFAACIGLVLLFGISSATMGDCHHSLIAEVTPPAQRSSTIAVVWTFTIISTIIAAGVIKTMMPTYTPASMQQVYNLTPLVVIISVLLGTVGMEKRLNPTDMAAAIERSRAASPAGNPVTASVRLLRENAQVRTFFGFIFLSILGIFLQDAVLEVFGAEAFNMTVKETTGFTQTWGGGVLIGMVIMGVIAAIRPLSKKAMATVGGAGTALGLGLLTLTAIMGQQTLLNPALILMGFATGIYNVGALALMMDMTKEGATGIYMGIWGVAQAFGTAFASILSGAMHSLLIESKLLSVASGFSVIFGVETVIMVVGIALLRSVSVEEFHGVTRDDLTRAMETSASA